MICVEDYVYLVQFVENDDGIFKETSAWQARTLALQSIFIAVFVDLERAVDGWRSR